MNREAFTITTTYTSATNTTLTTINTIIIVQFTSRSFKNLLLQLFEHFI